MTLAYKVRQLMQAKQYEAALLYFKNNKVHVNVVDIASNNGLVADIISALRNTKAFDAAYRFLEIYNIEINSGTALRLQLSYGWLLYSHYKHMLGIPDSNFEAIEARVLHILKLIQHSADSYAATLIANLFRVCAQRQKLLIQPNAQWLIKLCTSIDVDKLPTECSTIQVERRGKTTDMELASLQELWYSMFSKALYETQQYAPCLELCKVASTKIANMHYDNALWFDRRCAQCLSGLKQNEKAIALYERIVNQKADWYLKSELAQLYWAVGKQTQAIDIARKAAASAGPINFKVELIEQMGTMLLATNEEVLALKHFFLSKHIRNSEGWKISHNLSQQIASCAAQISFEHTTKEQLIKELSIYWGFDNNKNDRIVGYIDTLNAATDKGRSGLLKDKNGKKAYFFIPNFISLYENLQIGKAYSYTLVSSEKGFKAIKMKAL